MSVRRPGLERQLNAARQDLTSLTKLLESRGVSPEERASHPRWRSLHARRLHLERRLRSADALTALAAELQQRKADRLAAEQAPPEPEPKKPAKAKKDNKKDKKSEPKAKSKESKGQESE